MDFEVNPNNEIVAQDQKENQVIENYAVPHTFLIINQDQNPANAVYNGI